MTKRISNNPEPSDEVRLLKERVDCISDWVWEIDLEGILRYSNNAVRELLGYVPDAIVGRSIFDLLADIDAGKCHHLLQEAIAQNKQIDKTIAHFKAKDSSSRTLELKCTPMFDADAALVGYRGVGRDVTDQLARLQDALEAEANYKIVAENSQTGLFIVQNNIVVYTNPRICELMGYDCDEVVGTLIWKYVHPEDALMLASYELRRIAGEDVPSHYEARGITKSGEVRHFDFRASVVQHKGAPAVLLNAVDITDSIRAQAALSKSERDYRELVEDISDWVWQVDEHAVYTYASPRCRDLLGYEPEEVVGKTPFDFMLADEAVRVKALFAGPAAKHEPFNLLENTLVNRDGHLVVVETSGSPVFDEQGVFRGYRGIDRDVTARKRAEEQLRETTSEMETVLHAFPDIYFWLDADGTITDYHAAEPSSLFTSPEEFLGKKIDEVVPEEVGRLFATAASLVASTGAVVPIEYPLDIPAGTRYYEARLLPLQDGQIIAIIRDITERKLAQDQLEDERNFISAVLDTAAALVIVLDRQGRIVKFNRECEATLGYTLDEVKDRPIWELFELPERVDLSREMFSHPQPDVVPGQYEGPWTTKDGTRRLLSWSNAVMLDDQGEVEFVIATGIDVTERRRSEEELRESREMLRIVMDNIPQFVFWKDINSVYIGCNENFARVAGLSSPAEIVGKTDYDMPWGKTEGDSYREWDRRVMDSDQPQYRISEPQLTAEGETIWLDTNKVPLHDAQGRVVGILGTYENITERKEAEQALQEAEAKYRSLVEETMVGVYLIQDDQFVYANPRMLEIFGATAEEVIGRSPLEFVTPDDRAVVADNIRKRMRGEIKIIRYGFRALRKDGTPFDVEVHGALTNYKGRPAIIGSLIDITERKRYIEALQDSEERYRQLFEHSPDMVMLISADSGTIIAMNPAVTRILGYAPYDVLGRTPWDLSPEFQADGRRSKDKAGELLRSARGAPSQRFDWAHKTKDESLVDCEVSLVAYRFHGEELIQAIVRDVTERKRADESRRKFEREIEMQKRSFYRETILSVTGGTLDICEREDVEPYIERAAFCYEVEDASQVSPARRKSEEFFLQQQLTGVRLDEFMVGVGEAVTNAIKHGMHGMVHAGSDDKSVWVAISDTGTGIESLILPRAVLLRGFSTKPSLGLGYSIMLEVSDRILLTTGEQGTTVVLIKEKVERDFSVMPGALPDTWSNIPG